MDNQSILNLIYLNNNAYLQLINLDISNFTPAQKLGWEKEKSKIEGLQKFLYQQIK